MGQTFKLGDHVRIVCSGEEGIIIGVATYSHAPDSVLIRYKTADGRALEAWWTTDALEEVITP